MRILQLAPLITPTNEYGGPITVALGQCAALQAAGHDVILAAGTRGYHVPPDSIENVRVKLFPATSLVPGSALSGLTSPSLLAWIHRVASSVDVVHIHLARDLLVLPAAYLCARAGVPFVVQTHGMVVESDNILSRPLDMLMTRYVMSRAARVFYLTESELSSLNALFPDAHPEHLRNGIRTTEPRIGQPPAPLEVLYLARLHERKRPVDFVKMATQLASEFPEARFRMLGPDEGEGEAVSAAIEDARLGGRLVWEGAVPPSQTAAAMARASIYVLPSISEPYPMSVLEALSHSLPVVITDTCGLAALVGQAGAGAVVQAGPAPVTEAVRHLLDDFDARMTASIAAYELASRELGMESVTRQLTQAYEGATRR